MSTFGKCKGGGRRSAPRERSALTAVFATITDSHRAVVVDVSPTGIRLIGARFPRVGESVEVTVEKVRAFGSVMWLHDAECGIEFDEPLSAAEVAVLRQRASNLGRLPPELKQALDDWTTGLAR
jgi:hypothetical protein